MNAMRKREHPAGTVAPSRAFLLCPHCQFPMTIRDSDRTTRTIKEFYVLCSHVHCGFRARWMASPIHEICPSQMPHPEVFIEPCPHDYVRRAAERRRGEVDPDQLLMFPESTERIPEPLATSAAA